MADLFGGDDLFSFAEEDNNNEKTNEKNEDINDENDITININSIEINDDENKPQPKNLFEVAEESNKLEKERINKKRKREEEETKKQKELEKSYGLFNNNNEDEDEDEDEDEEDEQKNEQKNEQNTEEEKNNNIEVIIEESAQKKRRLNEEEEKKQKEQKQKEKKEKEKDVEKMFKKNSKNNLTSRETCLHEVSLPPNYNGKDPKLMIEEKIDTKPAKEYPFKLDAFQAQAVKCIEHNQSVLVSAHTSAGKTAVAEYAIAKCLKIKSRVVYTSPIKALSNQKYRELQKEFNDVGLMTGDVTISPNASCLVMTTEILRSMLFRGSELLNEVSWVIFDEVHYMRDVARGVVWEETIILLPNTVKFVFLSATIPNAKEFAGWIAKLKNHPVHVVYTEFRPTPLQHYLYPPGSQGIYLLVDEKGKFKSDSFKSSMEKVLEQKQSNQKQTMLGSGKGGKRQKRGGKDKLNTIDELLKVIKLIKQKELDPVVLFNFSRKDCELLAVKVAHLNLTNNEEKTLIQEVFENAVDSLSEDDQKLPQVEQMLPILKNGIGIHHSGLLPVIKELVEILFQEGLLKVLFATETFAMGLNMPARTVVFTKTSKFDGEKIRLITSGEYIQMSGRAGRRGLDSRGIVIVMYDDQSMKMNEEIVQKMMTGKADPLNSSFHLSYYMILNLLRVDEISPEYIMERSFFQFQSEKERPLLQKKYDKLELKWKDINDSIPKDQINHLELMFLLRNQLENQRMKLNKFKTLPIAALQFMQAGRIVQVSEWGSFQNNDDDDEDEDEGILGKKLKINKKTILKPRNNWGWGVVLNYKHKFINNKVEQKSKIKNHKASDYLVDILLIKEKGQGFENLTEKDVEITQVEMNLISEISSIRIYVNQLIDTNDGKKSILMRFKDINKRFPDGIPLIDPIVDMKLKSKGLIEVAKNIESIEKKLLENPIFQRIENEENDNKKIEKQNEIENNYQLVCKKSYFENDLKQLKMKIKKVGQLSLQETYKKMLRVLRRLHFTNQKNVLETKGRVAAEISAGDELVLTEMLFSGVFNDLNSPELAAIISCFVCQPYPITKLSNKKLEKNDKIIQKMPKNILKAFKKMQDIAKKVGEVKEESKIEITVEDYINSLSPEILLVVYSWCKGAKFSEIMKIGDEFEGTLIRMMRRLEELLRQMTVVSKTIGDESLEKKFLDSIKLIKRDIIFSGSLYL